MYVKYIMRYIRYFSELHNFRKEIDSATGLLNCTISREGLPTEVG